MKKQIINIALGTILILLIGIVLIPVARRVFFAFERTTECSRSEYSLIQTYQKDDPILIPLVKEAMKDNVITQYELRQIRNAKCDNAELGDIKKELK